MLRGLDQIEQNLDRLQEQIRKKVERAANEIAALLKGYAKTHHAWIPRTGNTDVSTKGTVEAAEDIITIYLSAGMEYDVFLELAREGKWSWLFPAVEAYEDVIRAKLETILGKGTKFSQGEGIETDIGITDFGNE